MLDPEALDYGVALVLSCVLHGTGLPSVGEFVRQPGAIAWDTTMVLPARGGSEGRPWLMLKLD